MNLSDFWELTPYEFSIVMDGYTERIKAEQEERIALSYVTALWTAQWFSKRRPPKLNEIIKKETKKMTDDQMLNAVKALNIALNGEVT